MTAPSVTADLMAYNFNLETTSFLSQSRKPPPQTLVGQSFLHELAREGDSLTAEVILLAGGEIDLPDDQGRRPLHEAAAFGQVGMAAFLLLNGALVDAPIHPFGHTALYLAVERGQTGTAALLLDAGARLGVTDRLSGQGLLHMAAAKGDMQMAGILIAAGIDVFREDRKGQTARDYAAKYNNRELERALLKVMEHQARC
jgi:ankyrin repeat protein